MGFIFNEAALQLTSGGTLNWASDTIKVRPLTTAAGAPDKDATAMTGLGVTGYDVTVAAKTKTKDTATDRVVFDFDNFVLPAVLGAVGEVNRFVVFKFVTNDAGSTPIAVVDMTAITPNGGDINVTVSTSGAFYLQE